MELLNNDISLLLPLAVSLLWMLWRGPPLAVVVRNLRPYVTAFGLMGWILGRLWLGYSGDYSRSLLDVMVDSLHHTIQQASSLWILLAPALEKSGILLEDFLAILLVRALWRIAYCLCHYSLSEWQDIVVHSVFEWSKERIPLVKSTIEQYRVKLGEDMQDYLRKDPNRVVTTRLPHDGQPVSKLIQDLTRLAREEKRGTEWGKVSGAMYTSDDDAQHSELAAAVYKAYSLSNPLHPEIWPSVSQMDAEVVAMTATLLHGGGEDCGAVGTTTSGGTESIILAIRAHLHYYGRRRGVAHPEIVCSRTAHASVDKACEMFGIRKVVVACDPDTFTLIPKQVERHITSNTIMIYASAPSYPLGVIDPVQDLSNIALRYGIGLHVDACLGGFVLPFAKQIGYDIPKFDFECPGVTSMSADPHKFAYSTKGISVVLYRHAKLRHAQYFTYSKWTGGLYVTPTIAGSRPGGILASAWATLMSIGESGYQTRVKSLLEASRTVANGISKIPGIRVLGNQMPTMIVTFTSDDFNIYKLGDLMKKRGWHLRPTQDPAALHICLTLNTVPLVEKFIDEVREAVAEVRKVGGSTKGGTAGIYGMSGAMPAGPVDEILNTFSDLVYTP